MRSLWRRTGFDEWNRKALEKGYHFAIIQNPPFRKRVADMFRITITDARLALAKWIAPWELSEEDYR